MGVWHAVRVKTKVTLGVMRIGLANTPMAYVATATGQVLFALTPAGNSAQGICDRLVTSLNGSWTIIIIAIEGRPERVSRGATPMNVPTMVGHASFVAVVGTALRAV